ncbi:MAG: hypothetical protein J6K21_02670 [Bacilli bacterium]|nr:hypothetical protein [Bacilli bacterium]
MDLIILLVLIVAIAFFFKDYKNVVYFLGIVEILFRIIHFIGDHLKIIELNQFINKYIPSSLFTMLGKYADGLLYEILMWILLICFVSLEVYLVKYFFKRGK